ncbi:MAG TPA: response regulator transcription factor [Candidatus Sphingobacterium stercoripullorum]|uniref:Response regulator transcription factor n=1 Tax=Candidatus Sphingobacterium stercoripullorum TaxID=2838759 RepID=A0A9D1W9Q1_9SPHI|nr:response regulator transcription factor [Candidatus Sphingobacterium stercoripullorum]
MKRVLLADDHSIVRLGASIIIKEVLKTEDIVHAESYDEAKRKIQEAQYDLLILDLNMPGGNNIRMVQEILNLQPEIKILVFSSYDEQIYALRYIEAGAMGYLNKSTSMLELRDALERLKEGKKYMSDSVRDQYIEILTKSKTEVNKKNPLLTLSDRETDVAKQLIKGYGVVDVAKAMDLNPSTVSTYKSRIFKKLNIKNIPDLIKIFSLNTDQQFLD